MANTQSVPNSATPNAHKFTNTPKPRHNSNNQFAQTLSGDGARGSLNPKKCAHRMTLPRSQTLSQWTQTRRLSQILSLVTRAIALLRSTTLRLQTRPSSTISSNRKRETLGKMSNASSDMWSRLEAKTLRRINAGKMWWALSKSSKPPLAMTLSLWKTVLCKSNLQIRLQVSRPF